MLHIQNWTPVKTAEDSLILSDLTKTAQLQWHHWLASTSPKQSSKFYTVFTDLDEVLFYNNREYVQLNNTRHCNAV